jgi:hypothetical protein
MARVICRHIAYWKLHKRIDINFAWSYILITETRNVGMWLKDMDVPARYVRAQSYWLQNPLMHDRNYGPDMIF